MVFSLTKFSFKVYVEPDASVVSVESVSEQGLKSQDQYDLVWSKQENVDGLLLRSGASLGLLSAETNIAASESQDDTLSQQLHIILWHLSLNSKSRLAHQSSSVLHVCMS